MDPVSPPLCNLKIIFGESFNMYFLKIAQLVGWERRSYTIMLSDKKQKSFSNETFFTTPSRSRKHLKTLPIKCNHFEGRFVSYAVLAMTNLVRLVCLVTSLTCLRRVSFTFGSDQVQKKLYTLKDSTSHNRTNPKHLPKIEQKILGI